MQTSFVKFRQGTLHIIGQKCYPSVRRNGDAKGRYVFLLEGGGWVGVFWNFFAKKSWPSHIPEWIGAWPFTNTDTKTPDPPPTSSKTKITGSEITNRKCYSNNRLHGLSEEEVKSLSTSELDAHSSKVMEKMRGLLLRKCVFELTTPQCHEGIFQHFLSTDQKINFSTTLSILESPTIKRVLFRGMDIFPS